MILARDGMIDCYFTWISTEYALPATDENMIITVQDPDGSTHIEMGFYDGTGRYDFNGNALNADDRNVIAWASIAPYERNTEPGEKV